MFFLSNVLWSRELESPLPNAFYAEVELTVKVENLYHQNYPVIWSVITNKIFVIVEEGGFGRSVVKFFGRFPNFS